MAIYQSMQRVRFSSPDNYAKFQLVFQDVRRHLKELPGFVHLTWWVHSDDPTWYNEVSFWTSFETLSEWHQNIYHRHAKEWAVRTGCIMEDIITNFESKNSRLIRVCPTCAYIEDKAYELGQERAVLAKPCPKCGFSFPVMPETMTSTALFKDVAKTIDAIAAPQPSFIPTH